ncbi:MAG: PepSY domain-containing protein [Burkholderiales bacterium]|nr:PepSY domain-containing protein [Burkholderiales bacterium]
MKKQLALPLAAAVTGLAVLGSIAYANQSGILGNDAQTQLAATKIPLTAAIQAAESHVGGRATKAEIESERGTAYFEVEVTTPDQKTFDVKVDATTGKVIDARPDAADRKDEDSDDRD